MEKEELVAIANELYGICESYIKNFEVPFVLSLSQEETLICEARWAHWQWEHPMWRRLGTELYGLSLKHAERWGISTESVQKAGWRLGCALHHRLVVGDSLRQVKTHPIVALISLFGIYSAVQILLWWMGKTVRFFYGMIRFYFYLWIAVGLIWLYTQFSPPSS